MNERTNENQTRQDIKYNVKERQMTTQKQWHLFHKYMTYLFTDTILRAEFFEKIGYCGRFLTFLWFLGTALLQLFIKIRRQQLNTIPIFQSFV